MTTLSPALTPTERAHFLAHGYVLIKNAFPRDFALAEVREQFAAHGMDAARPETWRDERFSFRPTKHFALEDLAPRVHAAVLEILGADRVTGLGGMDNGMTASCFTGEGEPWAAPADNEGWHKDGHFFRHFLDSPEQALLGLPLWSDVQPQGGGTFIAPESIGVMARFLAARPQGVHPFDFAAPDIMRDCPARLEAVGEAGDYYLMHGYMMHSASRNPARRLRCISNTIFALAEPLNFNRPDPADFSLLELGVLNGLQVDRYNFQPTRDRVRTPDYTPLPASFK